MKILVLWADDRSTNLGVRALGQGVAALSRRVWPDAEIVFQNYGSRIPELPFGRLRSLARERVTGRRGMMRWLGDFDLAIDTRSGDSFSDIYGLRRHATMSAVASLVGQAGVPLVIAPQTIGPFQSRAGRLLARGTLRRARLVMARDDDSAAEARCLGRPVDVTATDVVFALRAEQADAHRDVLLNVSGLLWRPNPHVDHLAYRRAVRELIDRTRAMGREVALLAHVIDSVDTDNDVPALRDVRAGLDGAVELLVPDSLEHARRIIAGAEVVVASRMHACLNALSQGVPAISLAYSRKFDPLLRRLDWARTVDLRTDRDPASSAVAHLEDDGLRAEAAVTRGLAADQIAVAEKVLRGMR